MKKYILIPLMLISAIFSMHHDKDLHNRHESTIHDRSPEWLRKINPATITAAMKKTIFKKMVADDAEICQTMTSDMLDLIANELSDDLPTYSIDDIQDFIAQVKSHQNFKNNKDPGLILIFRDTNNAIKRKNNDYSAHYNPRCCPECIIV